MVGFMCDVELNGGLSIGMGGREVKLTRLQGLEGGRNRPLYIMGRWGVFNHITTSVNGRGPVAIKSHSQEVGIGVLFITTGTLLFTALVQR